MLAIRAKKLYDSNMATATIYARVPDHTKDGAEAYAADHGLTLTAALSELIGLGLEAAHNAASVATLQERALSLESQVRELRLAVREQELARERAENELSTLRQAAEVWVNRADVTVGTCPNCDQDLTSADLLVQGRCGRCQQSTTALIEPSSASVNGRDFLYALGAVGLMLGLVALAANTGSAPG